MSYASMGANAVLNVLQGGDVVMVAEGLDVFRVPVPENLRGVALRESGIRRHTGCHVVAFQEGRELQASPPPDARLPSGPHGELILVGTTADENRFMDRYNAARAKG
jgi:K+/H+ antiporter YhaU regulatory subunit KhtT